jgi:ABC-2 type transport system permease protein
MQTLFAPVVSSLLMLFVFKLAFGQSVSQSPGGVGFTTFLAPGVVMMAILNNAFANTSSSLIIAKVQGNSVDFLMPPLSPLELTIGFLSGAVTRGLLVGIVTYGAVWILQVTPFQVANVFAIFYFSIVASLFMGAVGLLGGIWADKFDHMAAVQNFVIMPLTMLSGTFYPIGRLPEPFVSISHFNPFFQMIDGFRYGFTGHAEGDLLFGGAMSLVITLALCVVCWSWLSRGYKLKA